MKTKILVSGLYHDLKVGIARLSIQQNDASSDIVEFRIISAKISRSGSSAG